MVVEIEINLDQLKKFLRNFNSIKRKALEDVSDTLENTLETEVFTNHNDTVSIPTKSELVSHIKAGGSSHTPPKTPKKGADYSPEYLARKRSLGENRPHKFMEYGFYHGTTVKVEGSAVIMEAKEPPTAENKGFDYLSHHEARRSVLKTAFLRGWNDLFKAIVKRLADEAQV